MFESGVDDIKDFVSHSEALFCYKEKIETDIADIEGCNIKENRKNLLKELGLEREKLFESFYDHYGDYDEHVKYLTDFIVSQGDTGRTYGENGMTLHDLIMDADKILHKKLYRIIFDTVGKDEIENVISGKHLEVDKVLSRVSIMVKYYFEIRNGVIKDNLKRCIQDSPYFAQLIDDPNCTVEDYINQFIDYYEDDTLDFIFKELEHVKIGKDYDSVDLKGNFGNFVTSIDLCLLAKFTNTLVFKGFLEFCSDKIINSGNSEENLEYRSINYVYGNVCLLFDELFPGTKRDDILECLDFRKVTIDSLHKCLDVFGRVLSNLKIRDIGVYILVSNALDTDKLEYVEQLFLKHKGKIFPQLKEYFFTEVYNLLFNGKNFQLSLDLDNIVSDLRKIYDQAKPHVGDISKKQRVEMEKTFMKNEKDEFRTEFFGVFSKYSAFFDSLDLKEFFVFIELFMPLLNDVQVAYKEKLNVDYRNFVYASLEEKFKKSHDNTIRQNEPVVPVAKKIDKAESHDCKQSPVNIVVEKKELPEGLVSDLKKYFGGNLNRRLERSLRSSFGKYKTSWYTKAKYGFDFDDEFFEILERYGFVCDDVDIVDHGKNPTTSLESKNSSDTFKGVDNEVDDSDILKLNDIIAKINESDVFEDKVEYYVQAFELFYDFKNVELFKSQLLESIRCDNRILKGIESVLDKILKGQKEELKTSKNWKKRYFTFDIAYNTGYRIVLNGQQGKSRKIIVDFVDHDTYLDRIPFYYCKY